MALSWLCACNTRPVSYTHLDVYKRQVQAYMATYRKAEAVVEQFNRDLAAWEQQVREKQKPAKKEQRCV